MKKLSISVLAIVSGVLYLSIPVAAADKPAAPAAKTTHAATIRNAWPAETIAAKIDTVNPDHHLLIVQGTNQVPFDMIITARTRIKSGDKRIGFADLAGDQGKTVTIKFVPERRGDVAESITMGS